MNNLPWLLLAILAAYTLAAVAPLLRSRLRGRAGTVAGWYLMPILLVCPALIPPESTALRAVSAFVSGEIAFRMVEFFRQWDHVEPSLVLREYYRFLIPFPSLSVLYPDHKRRLPHPARLWPQLLRVFGGILGCVLAIKGLQALGRFPAVQSSFALNHAVMLAAFLVAIESLSRALYGLERLAGFDTTPIIRNAYLSRTVSEFWQRYNHRMHDWLYRNVFQPTGGRHTPARAVLLVFVVSGLIHELAFAIATSRLTGYQLAFFTIQGPAALASGRLERLARRGGLTGKFVAHGLTILFLAVTSVLFFDGVHTVFPFIYATPSPLP